MSYDYKTNRYIGYIYCLENDVNNKLYIGQTTRNAKIRFDEHIRHSKNSCLKNSSNKTLILYSINKIGCSHFNYVIIKTVKANSKLELKQLLDTYEVQIINDMQTLAPNGYNVSKGGDIDFGGLNRVMIAQYNLDGNFLKSYNSVQEAIKENHNHAISTVINNPQRCSYAGNYMWLKINENEVIPSKIEPYNNNKWKRKCKIIQVDYDGNIINTYNSINEAHIKTQINNVLIGDCVNGRYGRLTAGGYRWVKIDFGTDTNELKFDKYIPIYKCMKSINLYDTGRNYIKTFLTKKECADYFHIGKDKLNSYLEKNKLGDEFFIYYADDESQPDKSKIYK